MYVYLISIPNGISFNVKMIFYFVLYLLKWFEAQRCETDESKFSFSTYEGVKKKKLLKGRFGHCTKFMTDLSSVYRQSRRSAIVGRWTGETLAAKIPSLSNSKTSICSPIINN